MVLLFLAAIVSGYALLGLLELGVIDPGTFATVLEFVGAGAVIVFALVLIIKALVAFFGNFNSTFK